MLPHFYAPESWRLPLRIGFVAEFSFQKTRYEENSRKIELEAQTFFALAGIQPGDRELQRPP
jgi:hypothetical protein